MDPAKREDYTEMLLAEGGKARCTVVIAEDAGEKVRAAAEDFRNLLKKMSGAACPLATENEADKLPAGGRAGPDRPVPSDRGNGIGNAPGLSRK